MCDRIESIKSFDITMPAELLDYVRSRTKEGGFGTPTEFMRHLIRTRREEQREKELEARLLEGVKSGRSRVPGKAFFKRLHAMIDEVAADKRKGGGMGRRLVRRRVG